VGGSSALCTSVFQLCKHSELRFGDSWYLHCLLTLSRCSQEPRNPLAWAAARSDFSFKNKTISTREGVLTKTFSKVKYDYINYSDRQKA